MQYFGLIIIIMKNLKGFIISDLHYDAYYNASCSNQDYCQSTINNNTCSLANYKAKSGRYHCDSPNLLIENTLISMLSTNDQADFILLIGDYVAHNNLEPLYAIEHVIKSFSISYNPNNTQFIPVLGNNDFLIDYCAIIGPNEYYQNITTIFNTKKVTCSL